MPWRDKTSSEDEQRKMQTQQEAEASHSSLEHGGLPFQATRRLSKYEWDENVLEYMAFGTAIRLPNTALPPRPFLSDLSGQVFWALLQAGYSPDCVVTGFCSYYVSLGSRATRQLNTYVGGWANQEIVPFSQALYTARSRAMDRLLNMSRALNAIGVVGMHIHCKRTVMAHESNDIKFTGQFSAIGTAITEQKKGHVIPTVQPTLSFTDLRLGQRGEARELTIRK